MARLLWWLIGGPLRFLLAFARTARGVLREFAQRRGFQHAAAISYFALLSIIPFFVLLVAGFGFVIQWIGPRYGSEAELVEIVTRAVRDIAPFLADEVAARLQAIIHARDAIGVVGAVFMFLAASLVFEAIETALKEVFGRSKSHFLVSRVIFFVFFAGLAVLILVLYMGLAIGSSWVSALGDESLAALVHRYRFLDELVSLSIVVGGFAIVVSYFAQRRIRLQALAYGSLLFYALFQASRWLFGAYIEHFARFDLVYGSLATIMIGVVWIYYSATVFLLAAVFMRRMHDGLEGTLEDEA